MICSTCHGEVIWKGPLSALTHTECQSCGRLNNQYIDSVELPLSDDEEEGAKHNG